jgi:16S rRNA (adenine1518-N6/adenine1519-N6)-dimethyltransferase
MRPAPEWEDPRRVLGRYGMRPKASFSQNFLVARDVVDSIVAAMAIEPGDAVVELGAGLGTLTAGLLRAGARVWAVDRDRDMLHVLEAELSGVAGFELIPGDAAAVDLASLARAAGGPLKLAGNLPYAITGAILRHLVDERHALERAVIMIQREVRDRLLAPPGEKAYGALTVFTRAAFEIEPVRLVRAGAFHPPPKVESAVIRLRPRARPLAEETEMFRTVVRGAFEQRRKTLRNALLAKGCAAEAVDHALAEAGIDGRVRGETLAVEAFDHLARALSTAP